MRCFLLFFFFIPIPLLKSEPSVSPSPKEASSLSELKKKYHELCDGVMSQTLSVPGGKGNESVVTTPSEQLKTYCLAAQSAIKSAQTLSALWIVWAGVAGVCLAGCAASFGLYSAQWVCLASDVAAAITDAALTQNFMVAMTGIMGAASGYAVNSMTQKPEEEKKSTGESLTSEEGKKNRESSEKSLNSSPSSSNSSPSSSNSSPSSSIGEAHQDEMNQKSLNKDYGGCVVASVAAYQAYADYELYKNHQDTIKKNLKSAQDLLSSGSSSSLFLSGVSSQAGSLNGASSAGSVSGEKNISLGVSSSSGEEGTKGPCSERGESAQAGFIFQCAAAMDSSLPPFVKDGQFPEMVKKVTGEDLTRLWEDPHSHPDKALASLMGGAFLPEQTNQELHQAVLKFGSEVSDSFGTSSVYQGSGLGKSGGSLDSGNQILSQLLSRISGKGSAVEDSQKGGGAEIVFSMSSPSLFKESVLGDQGNSLFHRIHNRYTQFMKVNP